MRLAIDIGGTWLRWESVGEEEFCGKIPSSQTDLIDFIEATLKEYPQIDAVAVSFAGQVHDGTILSAPNIRVKEHEIRDWLEAKYGIRLLIENDLNCAALAESVYWNSPYLCALYSDSSSGEAAPWPERSDTCPTGRRLSAAAAARRTAWSSTPRAAAWPNGWSFGTVPENPTCKASGRAVTQRAGRSPSGTSTPCSTPPPRWSPSAIPKSWSSEAA